jgi:hypothetical protein
VVSNLPARNRSLSGRDDLLKLHASLQAERRRR